MQSKGNDNKVLKLQSNIPFRFHLISAARHLGWVFDSTLEFIMGILLVSSLMVTLIQVFLRYFLKNPVTWSEEFSRFCFLWLVFLGAAAVTRHKRHVILDTLVGYIPVWGKKLYSLFSNFLIALTCITLVYYGWKLTASTMESASIAMQWPVGLFYASVPVGAALIIVNMLREGIEGRDYLTSVLVAVFVGLAWYFLFIRMVVQPPKLNPGIVTLISFFVFLMLGTPVAFSIGIGVMLGLWVGATVPFTALAHGLANGVDSFILLAIPFFLLTGELMNVSGVMERLFRFCSVLVGHITGGLGHVNVLASLVLGGMSGSSLADASATSKILIPVMEKRGYPKVFSCAVTASSSMLANLIPPSICMMIYATIVWCSVGRLFFAGIVPGILCALGMMIVVYLVSKRRGYKGLEKRATLTEVWKETRSAAWALGTPVIILGGIRFGIVTPTEAAALAAFWTFFVGMFIYKGLKWVQMPGIFMRMGYETAIFMLILGFASPLNWILTAEQIPQAMANAMLSVSSSPLLFLLMVNILLLIVGLPMEAAPGIIILMPILAPMLPPLGINPIHFGIIVITNLLIGGITPPAGNVVFATAAITGCSSNDVFKESLPYFGTLIFVLLIITYIPQISLFLPNLLM